MKITLTKVHYAAFASEETSCFDAVVCLDGIPSLTARNSGHGGCTDLNEIVPGSLAKLKAYAKTLPPVVCSDMRDPHDKSKPFSYEQSDEGLVDEALNEYLALRDLRRLLKRTTAFVVNGEVRTFTKLPYVAQNFDRISAYLAKSHPTAKVLNGMKEDDALALYLHPAAA